MLSALQLDFGDFKESQEHVDFFHWRQNCLKAEKDPHDTQMPFSLDSNICSSSSVSQETMRGVYNATSPSLTLGI